MLLERILKSKDEETYQLYIYIYCLHIYIHIEVWKKPTYNSGTNKRLGFSYIFWHLYITHKVYIYM